MQTGFHDDGFMTTKLVIFTDLDGCLLNKADYDWTAAKPVLSRLQRQQVPVVLNSSKTPAEMSRLAEQFGLTGLPFISENGGVIQWNDFHQNEPDGRTIPGVPRVQILDLLRSLHQEFQFRSFVDLGIDGVMKATDLDRESARLASDRQSTEPLLWDDTAEALSEFRSAVEEAGLTLTKGGRFWHVTGQNSKGAAMRLVAERFAQTQPEARWVTAGIGDSPIDQSMLDEADYPIGIPAGGTLNICVPQDQGIVACEEGSAGWAESVTRLLQVVEAN